MMVDGGAGATGALDPRGKYAAAAMTARAASRIQRWVRLLISPEAMMRSSGWTNAADVPSYGRAESGRSGRIFDDLPCDFVVAVMAGCLRLDTVMEDFPSRARVEDGASGAWSSVRNSAKCEESEEARGDGEGAEDRCVDRACADVRLADRSTHRVDAVRDRVHEDENAHPGR